MRNNTNERVCAICSKTTSNWKSVNFGHYQCYDGCDRNGIVDKIIAHLFRKQTRELKDDSFGRW